MYEIESIFLNHPLINVTVKRVHATIFKAYVYWTVHHCDS